MNHCTVIVYEDGTIKRTILIEGDEKSGATGEKAERVFLDTISEEIGHEFGNDFTEEDIAEALEDGRIEVNGGCYLQYYR